MKQTDQDHETPLRDILTSEYGVIFFPRRLLVLPQLEAEKYLTRFKPEDADLVLSSVDDLQRFLRAQAVGDNFGKNHSARRVWRAEMYRKFGDAFLDIYYRTNQLRRGRLGLVNAGINDLAGCVRADTYQELANALHQRGRITKELLTGTRYNDTDSLEEKLEIVHIFEDRALEALQLLV
ncbi:MAG: hypothetical protein WC775_03065 [Patescibacteria group bacterium]|jgi:hypothetical protein